MTVTVVISATKGRIVTRALCGAVGSTGHFEYVWCTFENLQFFPRHVFCEN